MTERTYIKKRKYIKLSDGRLVEIPTPEESAAINAGIAADPDTYEPTPEEMAEFRPISERVGRPKAEVTKERISIRLAPEVTEYFRATGKGWQTRMGDVLKEYVEEHS